MHGFISGLSILFLWSIFRVFFFSFVPVPFIEEAVFAPLYILTSFVKNKVLIGAWGYLWALYLVPYTQNGLKT